VTVRGLRIGLLAALLAPLGAGRALAQAPLTLDDALRIAHAHQPSIEAQRGQVTAAGGRREQALAALLPFVNGSFAYQPQTPNLVVTPSLQRGLLASTGRDTVVDAAGMPVIVTCRTPGLGDCATLPQAAASWAPQSFWSVQVGLSWTLWDWGRSIYGYRSAHDLSQAARVGVQTVERDVVLETTLAFFGAFAADEQTAVAEDAVRTYNAHLAQTRGLHDAGLRTGIDVATAESALASVAITLARARATQQTARAQLVLALGEDRWRDWTLIADSAAFEPQPADERRAGAPLEALTDLAFRQRTELRQLWLQERAVDATVRAARGSYLPQIALELGPSWAGTELTSLTSNLNVTLVLGYPTSGMSPLLVHGQTREAEGNLVAARAQERSTRDSIRQETVDARALLSSAREEVRLAHALVEAAARQRALAEGRYQSGLGNVIELYDALLTDVNARFQMVQARLDLATARARLQHALGEGG
jgi:outer membrane protein TolC